MKLSRLFNSLPKRLIAGALVALAVMLPVAASSAAATVALEGSLGVANVTNGDTTYKPAVNASYDQVVKLQVYYHNRELPDSGKNAQNLRVKISIPTGAGKTQTVSSTISADNANTINSTATINLDGTDAYLQYIPGSAVWKHNTGTNDNITYTETKISDAVVTGGAGLVLENEKPCFNFAATVTVEARVMVPGVKIVKEVEKSTETGKYAQTNVANPGDTLKYKISYQNTGNTTEKSVVIRDSLPNKLTLVPNSTYLYNSNNANGVLIKSDNITNGGIVIGDYAPGAVAYIVFEAKVPAIDSLVCGDTVFTNVGVAHPSGMQEYYNTAKTTVNKACTPVTNSPVYTCNAFGVSFDNASRTVTVNKFDYTAQGGASFKSVLINWNTAAQDETLSTDAPLNKTHQYSDYRTYNLTAKVLFSVNGKDVYAPIPDSCATSVTFTPPTTPPTTPPVVTPPAQLPNTGAGNVIGIFAGAVVAGTIGYRLFLSRKLARR